MFLFAADEAVDGGAPFEVEEVWEHRGRIIFKFRGVDTISAAERLRGAEVRIPVAERPAPPAGEFYHSDLIACRVVDAATGQEIGRVAEWRDEGGPGLLVVGTAGGEELLIPFARSICVEIDIAAGRIAVNLPEGLKELNRA